MILKTAIITVILITILSSLLVLPAGADPITPSGTDLLDRVVTSLSDSLDEVDSNLTGIAGAFGATSMSNASGPAIVAPYRMNIPGLAGVVLIAGDKNIAVLNESVLPQPLDNKVLKDTSISDSMKYIKPKMSNATLIPIAGQVVMITRPTVVDDIIGAAVTILLPGTFCEAIISPEINGTDAISVVMQPDGTILYSSAPAEMAKIPPDNFMTEFPTFRDVKNAMKTEKEGHISYELWRADPTEPHGRNGYWSTINLHGTEWRVLIAEAIR